MSQISVICGNADKRTVEAKARTLAELEEMLRGLGVANAVGMSAEDRIDHAVQYRIARDRANYARDEYSRAFEQWRLSGFRD